MTITISDQLDANGLAVYPLFFSFFFFFQPDVIHMYNSQCRNVQSREILAKFPSEEVGRALGKSLGSDIYVQARVYYIGLGL